MLLPCLPSIAFFKGLSCEKIPINPEIVYDKRYRLNQYKIATANGPLTLSIPLQKGRNQREKIHTIRIDYSTDWQKKHIKSLICAYNHSAWWAWYAPSFIPLYEKKHTFLLEKNIALTEWLLQALALPKSMLYISEKPHYKDILECIDKLKNPLPSIPYRQVFDSTNGFISGLSTLDLLVNMGKESKAYLS